jgi:hypothetical protein
MDDTSKLPTQSTQQPQQQVAITPDKLVTIEVKDENSALNLLVAFVNVAQQRGVFKIEESAKIFECIKMFQRSAAVGGSGSDKV